eukprot:TRINITY_DN71396_c0_g1_i1.p1 TRINITY_DN71396_c0_g1~~TRINITY_DN71396_c0_g1_i1.p1  ORF type:complete len:100 (-),score=16.29 TRINITY_DN71396_c0_g1_i1:65-364(-)
MQRERAAHKEDIVYINRTMSQLYMQVVAVKMTEQLEDVHRSLFDDYIVWTKARSMKPGKAVDSSSRSAEILDACGHSELFVGQLTASFNERSLQPPVLL